MPIRPAGEGSNTIYCRKLISMEPPKLNSNYDESGTGLSISNQARSVSLKIKESFDHLTAEDNAANGKVSPIELYNAIVAMGIVVPLKKFVTIFTDADKDNSGALDIEEFSEFVLQSSEKEEEAQNKHLTVLKKLTTDFKFWLVFSYIMAGLLLTIGSVRVSSIPELTLANMYLAASSVYLMGSGLHMIKFPIALWKQTSFREALCVTLKKGLTHKATAYQSVYTESIVHSNDAPPMANHHQIRDYISTVLFRNSDGGLKSYMSRKDLEKLLLIETGTAVTSSHLAEMFNNFDCAESGYISVKEMHMFLIELDKK